MTAPRISPHQIVLPLPVRRDFFGARTLLLLAVLAGSATACAPSPVIWEEPQGVAADVVSPEARLILTSTGDVDFSPVREIPPIEPANACPGSVRAAWYGTRESYAAWWEPRPDRSVILQVARHTGAPDAEWMEPVAADARDVGTLGCNRPPPSIVADSLGGYIHLAYFIDADIGSGVWFTHSMERGALFHQPMPVMYGERPSRADIDVVADTVVVAYEDPNSVRPSVGLGISRTAGHTFQHRVPVSPSGVSATDPRVVLDGRRVIVTWTQHQAGSELRGSSRTVRRVGELQ
jgi:hypothetical protein